MNSMIERLLSLRVEDVMSRDVIQIPMNAPMESAAAILHQHHITGAPVVDEQGGCVGIISGSDFVVREEERTNGDQQNGDAENSPDEASEYFLVQRRVGEPYHVEEVATNTVGQHMSSDVQTVLASTTMLEAARLLCQQHVHRLVVLGEESQPVGLLSSLDLVAALVKAAEE